MYDFRSLTELLIFWSSTVVLCFDSVEVFDFIQRSSKMGSVRGKCYRSYPRLSKGDSFNYHEVGPYGVIVNTY